MRKWRPRPLNFLVRCDPAAGTEAVEEGGVLKSGIISDTPELTEVRIRTIVER